MLFYFGIRRLHFFQVNRDAVDLSCELVVAFLVVLCDRRPVIRADIGALIGREDTTLRVLDPPFRYLLPVDEDGACAADALRRRLSLPVEIKMPSGISTSGLKVTLGSSDVTSAFKQTRSDGRTVGLLPQGSRASDGQGSTADRPRQWPVGDRWSLPDLSIEGRLVRRILIARPGRRPAAQKGRADRHPGPVSSPQEGPDADRPPTGCRCMTQEIS
jgi:hypothetical protein